MAYPKEYRRLGGASQLATEQTPISTSDLFHSTPNYSTNNNHQEVKRNENSSFNLADHDQQTNSGTPIITEKPVLNNNSTSIQF